MLAVQPALALVELVDEYPVFKNEINRDLDWLTYINKYRDEKNAFLRKRQRRGLKYKFS